PLDPFASKIALGERSFESRALVNSLPNPPESLHHGLKGTSGRRVRKRGLRTTAVALVAGAALGTASVVDAGGIAHWFRGFGKGFETSYRSSSGPAVTGEFP